MAKKAKIVKAQKQEKLIADYSELRRELKARHDYAGLAKLPRDSNPNRLKKRDRLDGRPRGYMGKFEMSRINFRQHALKGEIPGVTKASW